MKRKPRLLPVRIYGDEILRLKAREINALSPELEEFIADLTHTMYLRDGVGLAAQVSESLRVIVIDRAVQEGRESLVMIAHLGRRRGATPRKAASASRCCLSPAPPASHLSIRMWSLPNAAWSWKATPR